MTIDDHEASRPIVLPLRLFDYCLINDGAVCMILTTAERARDLARPAVALSGFAGREAYRTATIGNFDFDFWYDEVRGLRARGLRHGRRRPSPTSMR